MLVVAFFIIAKTGNNPDVYWQKYVDTSFNLHHRILYKKEHEWTIAVCINVDESQKFWMKKESCKGILRLWCQLV